ncbi:hypothetical protein [Asticcacaulis sp. AC402]|uniref:ribbon-helix-helix domain-containing protein n=1 Tax=Asticcacaulis sp. AC402 TaxID=1282361 RepID=UPI00058D8919|nr:hypothetical protein [Asticcacaulis sp. AC402]
MDRITVSLDDGNSDWVQQQAGTNADAYVNGVLRKDQERKTAEAEVNRLLDEADDSGVSDKTIEQIWEDAEARYRAQNG